MTSERLYYTDSYLSAFDAVVRSAQSQGDRWVVTLDRTAFYPTSGGQPFDTGTLGEARVIEVVDQADGTVGHLVDRALAVNERVRCTIDWDRRFDHMQQHSGQHVLSAAFAREHAARTVSFHLGVESSTIDLDREVSAEAVASAELAANHVIWEDRPLSVRFATAEEAAKLPLRKESARVGELRLVEIPDYDLSACGGTHAGSTGAIGMIAIASAERFKGGMRIEFLCGGRALRAVRSLRQAVAGSVRLLSVLPQELPSAIERLQAEARGQKKALEALQEQLAAHEAARASAQGEKMGGVTVIMEVVPGWDAAGLKKLASVITAAPGMAAVLLSVESPHSVVVARSNDVVLDAGLILRKLVERFGGRGGGKASLAQGGGLDKPPQEIMSVARGLMADELRRPGQPAT